MKQLLSILSIQAHAWKPVISAVAVLTASICVNVFLPIGYAAADTEKYQHRACSRTSIAALNGCRFESKDDYWVNRGKCENLSTPMERRECRIEEKEVLEEAFSECKEQFLARKEVCDALGEEAYNPEIDPNHFMDKAGIIANPNPYFPLIPGTTWVYESGDETIRVTVTDETKEIQGVTTIVVQDVVTEDGELIEDTFDWYAQDFQGNVWYMGEIAKNYEDGELTDVEGSWQAGVDAASAGILMKAVPMIGDVYRQEFLLADAEDMAEVIQLDGSESVPAATCTDDCLVTKEYTPLEPGVVEYKYYAPGVGLILEVDPETGERAELVEIIN